MSKTINIFLVLCCFLITFSYAQTQTIVIDDFSEGNYYFFVRYNTSLPPPQTNTSFYSNTTGNGLIGFERDIQLTVKTSQNESNVYYTVVSQGHTQTVFESTATGYVIYQYDGIDGSMSVNSTGFTSISPGGLNFTQYAAVQVVAGFNRPSSFKCVVYDITGKTCSNNMTVVATGSEISYYFTMSGFTGSCSMEHVGAFNLYISLPATVYIESITLPAQLTHSATPMISNGASPPPSRSNPPTTYPSKSNQPSKSKSKAPSS